MNTHNNFPNEQSTTHPEAPKKGHITKMVGKIARKAAVFADNAAEAMTSMSVPGTATYLRAVTGELSKSGAKGGEMRTGEKFTTYLGAGLAEAQTATGERRTLQSIAFIGDSAIGIVASSRKEGEFQKFTGVDVMLLPFGRHKMSEGGGQNTKPLANLAHISLADLQKPRQDGVVQPWESTTVGRSDTGDQYVSGKHLKIDVTADGLVEFINLSDINPTHVMNVNTRDEAMKISKQPQMLDDFMKYLNQDVHSWEPNPQGQIIRGV